LFEEAHQDVDIDIAPEDEVVGQEIAIEGAEVPLAGRNLEGSCSNHLQQINFWSTVWSLQWTAVCVR
jgi:hypothetical protein